MRPYSRLNMMFVTIVLVVAAASHQAAAQTIQDGFDNLHQNYGTLCQQSQGMAPGCGGASTAAAAPAAPAVPAGPTVQQQMVLGAAQAAMPYPQQAVHNFFYGTPTAPVPPTDTEAQQRQLAANPLNSSGVCLMRQRNYAGAINEFQQALALDPDDATILHNLAMARQMQKNAAFAGETSGALGQLLGTAPAGTLNFAAGLNFAGSDFSSDAVDLRSATGTSVDPASLKGQLDDVLGNNAPPQPAATEPPAQAARDIDSLFQSPSATPTSAVDQKVGNLNAQCASSVAGSAAGAACQQQQAELVDAKAKQLDQILSPEEKAELKDGPNNHPSSIQGQASASGSGNAGGNNQPAAGGQTNFFGSSGVSPDQAGTVAPTNAAPANIKNAREGLTSINATVTGAAAGGNPAETMANQADIGFGTPATAQPTAIPINRNIPQAPATSPITLSLQNKAGCGPAL